MSVHLPLVSSLAHSTSVSSLVMWPFSGPQQAGVIKQATSTQLRQLPYGRAGWPTRIRIKRGHLSDQEASNAPIKWRAHQYTISGLTIKKKGTTPGCLATMPRGLGTTPLRTARCPAVLSTANVPVTASKAHHGPPDNQPCT